jgi:DNA-directed RNA polymerase specialized sigma24 family protein
MHTTAAAPRTSRDSRVDAIATRLLEERGEHLLNIARRNSSNRDDAEEAFQEAFMSFLRKFDPEGEAPPLPWVIVTLKRECWARRRSASREQLLQKLRLDTQAELVKYAFEHGLIETSGP